MRHIKTYQIFEASAPALTQEQKDWLDECTFDGSWSVNPQTGLVDVNGTFSCEGQILRDFKGVRFGDVVGDFACSANSLTSLEGAPHSVGVDFHCHDNQLTSLEGAPQKVGGDFDCSHNSITSLEGAPREIGGDFVCNDSQLVSLKGAPQEVDGYFYFSGNPISEDAIMDIIQTMNDRGITLEEAVSECWSDLEDEDKLYLYKHNPDLTEEERREYEALERLKTRVI